MDRIDRSCGPRAVSLRLPGWALAWLGLTLPAAAWAQPAPFLERLQLPDASTLLVLGAGFGVVLIAVAVLIFAIRQLRREAAERRRLYTRHRRVGRDRASQLGHPPTPTTD